jgi:putative ABC transport system permease protein
VGKRVATGLDDSGNVVRHTIVGVVKDFNTYSLQHKIQPLVIFMAKKANDQDNLYVRVSNTDIPASLDFITKTFREFDPENAVDYHFLDQNFAAQYQSEQKQGRLLLIFTVLTISIACFGLFGLVTFTAEQKTKEIGVRKVLGASVANITMMLSKDYVQLILISLIVACPLAWYFMNRWLENFAFRISISPWIFIIAGALIAIIAIVTISFQSIKAATANPVKSLRSE